MSYDDGFAKLIKLGDEFIAASNHMGSLLRECERIGVAPPRDLWLSTLGPAAAWREGNTLVAYAWKGGVECWEDGQPVLKADANTAAAWLKGRVR